jgi:hypothetical protein
MRKLCGRHGPAEEVALSFRTVAGLKEFELFLSLKGQLFRKTASIFAGQAVGIKEVHDDIWLVSFMDYDLGYFDLETRALEPLENPFGPKVLPMS